MLLLLNVQFLVVVNHALLRAVERLSLCHEDLLTDVGMFLVRLWCKPPLAVPALKQSVVLWRCPLSLQTGGELSHVNKHRFTYIALSFKET